MDKICSVIGIVLVTIGTIFSLLSVLSTRSGDYWTAGWMDKQPENFKNDKKKVIIGTILIIIGSIFQIAGMFL